MKEVEHCHTVVPTDVGDDARTSEVDDKMEKA
jgi:hypothetical protein